jgi:hypothetical protein
MVKRRADTPGDSVTDPGTGMGVPALSPTTTSPTTTLFTPTVIVAFPPVDVALSRKLNFFEEVPVHGAANRRSTVRARTRMWGENVGAILRACQRMWGGNKCAVDTSE